MRRRRREKRRTTDAGGHARERGVLRQEEYYVATLRYFQLAAAAIMFVGLTAATLVCAGESKQPWLAIAGGLVFLLGVLGYFAAPPAARRWLRRK